MRYAVFGLAGVFALAAADAQAHQCYRRVVEPPQYSTVSEEVLVTPARDVAEYVPAVTRQVAETVVVRPATTVTHVIPPQYGYETQTVEVAPAHREWRTRDENGDVIGCWVNVPAQLGQVSRRVVIRPAQEMAEEIPAETATRVRTEVVEPAHTIVHTIPPRYVTQERQVLVAPGGAHWAPIDQVCDRY